MQTFLPFPDFAACAKVLDYKRLGKQRVECLQLLQALTGQTQGWVNHPAARMWRGYTDSLALYGITVCQEWRAKGYKDTCLEKIMQFRTGMCLTPAWLGNLEFHASHRAALLAKDYTFYSQYGWKETPKIEYVWPV